MQNKPGRRRFIAGAVCPRCGEMDKIVVDMDSEQRECVACGFSEGRPGEGRPGEGRPGDPASSTELPTRVSRAAARRVETEAEPVKSIDPD